MSAIYNPTVANHTYGTPKPVGTNGNRGGGNRKR